MTTSTSSSPRSPLMATYGTLMVTNSDGIVESTLTRSPIACFIETIRENKKNWSIGDNLGVAYHFTGDRLYKQNNVVNRSGVRTRVEIRNLAPFFTKLYANMVQYPFVKVQLCGSAEAYLMYCHSKLVRLEPKRNVLLVGKVCFVQGHFNNYFAEPIPIAPGTLVKLHSRKFDIRISSNHHCIFVRTEDIIKNRVRLEQLDLSGQQPVEEEDESQEDSLDEQDEDNESFEPDSVNEDDTSTDGNRRGGRLHPTRFERRGSRHRFGTPQVMPPGTARRARMVNAATQTTPPRTVQRRRSPDYDDEARDDRRPHSI